MATAIVIDERDNVATALVPLEAGAPTTIRLRGSVVDGPVVRDKIPPGHKFALTRIRKDGYVIKYGEVIGKAMRDIDPGEHVHVHNVVSLRGRGDIPKHSCLE